jgi:hypothetical protein
MRWVNPTRVECCTYALFRFYAFNAGIVIVMGSRGFLCDLYYSLTTYMYCGFSANRKCPEIDSHQALLSPNDRVWFWYVMSCGGDDDDDGKRPRKRKGCFALLGELPIGRLAARLFSRKSPDRPEREPWSDILPLFFWYERYRASC